MFNVLLQVLDDGRLTEGLTGAAVIATYDPNNPASANSAQVAVLIGQLITLKYGRDDELEDAARSGCRLSGGHE